ncbi:GGDEF domain-containing protein [Streptomyces uncialis]|uniref:GGDEF domain-containing protein n=1 Tax=Streptomyces uncialis TaxID=1048205 RepID=UPI002F91F55A|nr:GGDEF domain-containing protein [Streptomyces uncialis]
MPAPAVLRQSPAALVTAAVVPLALAAVADGIRLRRRLAEAGRDQLTGALRRESWTPQAQRFLDRYHDQALVLVCDLDRFKQINDQRGHAVGDQALAETTARITAWAGSRGIVCRLGGDEFAAVTRIATGRRTLRLDQLNRALRQPVTTAIGPLDIAVSIGAASPDILKTRDLSELLRAADIAMYDGKHTGHPVQARPEHHAVPSVNGRRPGRPGTHHATPAAA